MRALELICRLIVGAFYLMAIEFLLVFCLVDILCRAVAGFWRGLVMDWKSWKGTK